MHSFHAMHRDHLDLKNNDDQLRKIKNSCRNPVSVADSRTDGGGDSFSISAVGRLSKARDFDFDIDYGQI